MGAASLSVIVLILGIGWRRNRGWTGCGRRSWSYRHWRAHHRGWSCGGSGRRLGRRGNGDRANHWLPFDLGDFFAPGHDRFTYFVEGSWGGSGRDLGAGGGGGTAATAQDGGWRWGGRSGCAGPLAGNGQ